MTHPPDGFPVSRRRFLQTATTGALFGLGKMAFGGQAEATLGAGNFRYRVVAGWGVLGPETPVNNCHGITCTAEGHIVVLTDHAPNNVLIYEPSGRLLNKWSAGLPGAHGLSVVREGRNEVLYMTCLQTHQVVKYTMDGAKLEEWRWPEQSGKYQKEADYRPSWTLHPPDGGFFVLDGYGRDYITRYDTEGKYAGIFGGAEGGITHWGPHGGMVDVGPQGASSLLIAMSDQQHLLRMSLDGKHLAQVALPGGNPRQIRKHKEHYFVAHLGDQWPKDKNSRGFVSILDDQLRVLANIGGSAPEYDTQGVLRPMSHQGEVFMHPHDLAVADDGCVYVAQFASGKTYPIKLERV